MELKYKILIKGTLTLETGLHIGGSEIDLEIGGIDKAVVKDKSTSSPYIPGSSLKGKLRDLIARKKGYPKPENDLDETFILFGDGSKGRVRTPGHLIVRDSFFIGDYDKDANLEEKAENTINRVTGGANPRIIERVVRGASFDLDMVLDVMSYYNVRKKERDGFDKNGKEKFKYPIYEKQNCEENQLMETLKIGFRLLENDYLGGSGTRGYGKVSLQFENPLKIEFGKNGTTTTEKIEFDFNNIP